MEALIKLVLEVDRKRNVQSPTFNEYVAKVINENAHILRAIEFTIFVTLGFVYLIIPLISKTMSRLKRNNSLNSTQTKESKSVETKPAPLSLPDPPSAHLPTKTVIEERVIFQQPLELINKFPKKLNIEPLSTMKQDAIQWFNIYELNTQDWPPNYRGKYVANYFRNEILNLWLNIAEELKHNYDHVKKYFIQNLMEEKETYKRKFFSRTQKNGESVTEYANDLMKLQKYGLDDPNTNEAKKDIIKQFVDGLRNEIKIPMMCQSHDTIESAIRSAKLLEKAQGEKTHEVINTIHEKKVSFKTYPSRPSSRSSTSSRSPHNRNNNNSKSTSSGGEKRANDEAYCQKCKKSGHTAKNCRLN